VERDSTLLAKDAAHVVGVTVQMLDYLEREGVFQREQSRWEAKSENRQRGVRRLYTFRDLIVLKSIAQLLANGVSVRRIKKAVEHFSREERFACDRDRVIFDQSPVQYFVTDGSDIFFRKDKTELVSVLEAGQQAFLFVMDLDQVRSQVGESLDTLPESRKSRRAIQRRRARR
jgi:DNA-binding transcriptional MerR regulator